MSIGQVLLVPNLTAEGDPYIPTPPLTDFFLEDYFLTEEVSPMQSPRTCEPGPGTLTIRDVGNKVSINGNQRLDVNHSTGTWNQAAFRHTAGVAFDTPGLLMACDFLGRSIKNFQLGLHFVASFQNNLNPGGIIVGSDIMARIGAGAITLRPFILDTKYRLVTVARTQGVHLILSGGDYPKDTLEWVDSTNDNTGDTLYAIMSPLTCDGWFDNLVVAGYWTPTPLASDSFDRVDNTDIGSTDGLAVEEEGGDGLQWQELRREFAIETNELAIGAGSNFGAACVDVNSADVFIQSDCIPLASQTNGLSARVNAVSESWNYLGLNTTFFRIFEFTAPSEQTQRASLSISATLGTPYAMVFIADGASLIGYFDSSNRISFDASAFNLAETKHGAYAYGLGGARWQNLVVWPRHPKVPTIPSGPDPDQLFLLLDQFITAEAHPIATPRVCEYGPGTFTVKTDNDGQFAIAGGELVCTGASAANDWLNFGITATAGINRVAGQMLVEAFQANNTGGNPYYNWGWNTTGAQGGTAWAQLQGGLNFASDALLKRWDAIVQVGATVGSYTSDAQYEMCTSLRSSGWFTMIKGGTEYSEWTLLVVEDEGTDTPLYPQLLMGTGNPKWDHVYVPDTLYTPTPLASDSFDRADSANLGSTDGAAVEESGGDGLAWVEQVGEWSINTNKLKIDVNDGGQPYGITVCQVNKADVFAQGTVNLGTGSSMGLAVRNTGVRADGCFYGFANQNTGFLLIHEYDGVDATQRASVAATINANTDYAIDVMADTTDIETYLDGGKPITYGTATRNQTTGVFVGARAYLNQSFTTTLDNFVVWPRHLTDFPDTTLPELPPYQLLDRFITDEAAPIASPRDCEPGPGQITVVDTDTVVSISAGALQVNDTSGTWSNHRFDGGTFTHQAGLMYVIDVNTNDKTSNFRVGFDKLATPTFPDPGILQFAANLAAKIGSPSVILGGYDALTTYRGVHILRDQGFHIVIKGGAYTSDTLLWVDATNSNLASTPYAIWQSHSTKGSLDNVAVLTDPYTPTPLASDSFDRADNSDLGSTDGLAVEEAGGSGLVWVTDGGQWQIISNKLASSAYVPMKSVKVPTSSPDVFIQATTVTNESGARTGLGARITDKDNAWSSGATHSTQRFAIHEVVAGGGTQRASVTTTILGLTDYVQTMIADGQSMAAYLDGADRITYDSAAFNESVTDHGCYSTWGNSSVTYDNLAVWPRHLTDFPDLS